MKSADFKIYRDERFDFDDQIFSDFHFVEFYPSRKEEYYRQLNKNTGPVKSFAMGHWWRKPRRSDSLTYRQHSSSSVQALHWGPLCYS